jgi:hypothetical protein
MSHQRDKEIRFPFTMPGSLGSRGFAPSAAKKVFKPVGKTLVSPTACRENRE